jgi:endonuclease/exonuclease/phosphatase family metal-dependent hydrolase
MSFNVRLGGKDFVGVKKTIMDAQPDMVGLQECSRATAEKIAKAMGYHMTFYSSPRHNNSIDNGRAILSKFPIQEAETKPYHIGFFDRVRSMWDRFKTQDGSLFERLAGVVVLWQKRTLLRSTFEVNGKPVDFIDTHLTTGDAAFTGAQFKQLQAYVEERKKLGHEVIVVGDFNTHFEPGAKQDASVAGYQGLQSSLTDAFKAAPDVKVTGLDGRVMSPAEAAEALKKPNLSAEERDILHRIAIGATLEHGHGRIDTVFTSSGITPSSFRIDQRNSASDHEPVFATLDLTSQQK